MKKKRFKKLRGTVFTDCERGSILKRWERRKKKMACKRRSRTRIHVRQKLYRSQSRSTTWKNSEVLPFPFFLSFVHRYYATSLRNPPSVLTPWNARSFALLNFKTRFRWRNIRFRSVLRYCSPSTFPLREERGQEMRIFIIQGRGFFTFDDLNYRSIFFKYSNLRDIHFGISFFKIFQILYIPVFPPIRWNF